MGSGALGPGGYTGENLFALSKEVHKRTCIVNRLYGRFRRLEQRTSGVSEWPSLFKLFSEAGEALIDLLVLADRIGYLKDAERFQRIQRKGILSTQEIMKIAGLKPGPKVGRAIKEMKRLQFDRVLARKTEARRWLRYFT